MALVSVSEDNLFVEREETKSLVTILAGNSNSLNDKNSALERLRKIFDNYLECPTLLRQDVRSIVSSLLQVARETLSNPAEISCFDQCSHALSAIYALSKVRGKKDIQRLLFHEVEDLDPVLRALQTFSNHGIAFNEKSEGSTSSCSEDSQPRRWESVCVLWNWMETLSLVPFNCSALFADSTSVIGSLIELGKLHLSHTGATREAAASALAAWLSRPDLESSEIPKFVSWSRLVLLEQCSRPSLDILRLLGIMQSLVRVVKVSSSSREKMLEYMAPLWEVFLRLEEYKVCDNNMLLRKLMVKWWSRMGCIYVPPYITSWRYQRGRRSLADNLAKGFHGNPKEKPGTAQDSGNTASFGAGVSHDCSQQPNQELWVISDEVEIAMGFILDKLQDSSTMVRWAAAKGVGRLTERLPAICADDVLDALLAMFINRDADNAWHGACLALAELGRRGLLLPHRLSQAVPMVVQAIQYDVIRGQSSVGAHVRDAACYTYWSFARAYDPQVLKPHVGILSESLILTCLFDREVNCRRAASAAFQECVGRQGADNFKHGISILTVADYFSLGNRKDAFTKISLHVAQFPEYRRKVIDHVYLVKLHHWDEAIRQLASKALHNLTPLDPEYIVAVVLPYLLSASQDPKDVPMRHGAILGLAECVLALGERERVIEECVSTNLAHKIAEIVPTIEKKRLYRGRGGEVVRRAVCRLIQCICAAKIPLFARQQVQLLDSVDACLSHPNQLIQETACEALQQLTINYFPVGPTGPSDRLQKRVVDNYLSRAQSGENPASTRGFSLALGYLPAKLLAPSSTVIESVVVTLSKVGRHTALVGNEKDAETRRNALMALNRVCRTVGLDAALRKLPCPEADTIVTGLDFNLVTLVFETFLRGLVDYNMDRRGDVGSWCRIEAMKGLVAMACLVANQATQEVLPRVWSPALAAKVISCILKQFCEKLDSVRVVAGVCLEAILTQDDPVIPGIPEKHYLRECLGLENGSAGIQSGLIGTTNWADAALTFPMVAKAAQVEVYFPAIMAGMIISVGGLTESIAKESNTAFLQLAKEATGSHRIIELSNVLLALFRSHSRDGRVTLPLLKSIETLLSHQYLNEVLQSNEQNSFKTTLLLCISEEVRYCKDVNRLFACIDVALGLVGSSSGDGPDGALGFACSQLVHIFPRVRRYAAEQLYICLLEHPQQVVVTTGNSGEALMDCLLNFPWDGAKRTAAHCRETAEKVAASVGVTLMLDLEPPNETSTKNYTHQDDFATYAALVETINKG